MNTHIPYSICLQTKYGHFLMNRYDAFQPIAIVRTGAPHIEREIQLLLTLVDSLPDGSIVLDAGANIGLIAIPLAQRLSARGGTVLAFEPQRLIYYMLAGNTVLSGLQNLVCCQIALGAEPGILFVRDIDPHEAQDFGAVSLVVPDEQGDPVQMTTIDAVTLDRLDLIKIDVEHMEESVLMGAENAIARFRPIIWIEVWPQHYGRIYNWMLNHDYCMFIADALNFCAVPTEKRQELPLVLPEFDGLSNPYFDELSNDRQGSEG